MDGAYRLNVNTSALIALTHKLEQTSRTAFPLAVRGTLNAAAFDVKRNTLQSSAKRNFIQRAPTFFKRFSTVVKAEGMEVNGMRSKVGMTNQGEQRASTAVGNLIYQEEGGSISKGLDYLKGARGGSNARKVVKSQYYNRSKNVRGKYKSANTAKSKFVASAYVALREKKRMTFKGRDGRRFTMLVTSVKKGRRIGVRIKTKLLYVSRDTHSAKIRATHFSREAAMQTLKKIPDFYRAEAEKQFRKVWK